MGRSPFADYVSRYDRGETIFAAGEAGSTLFVVQSGAVELLLPDDAGVLAVMEKGDFFGEMSLLEGTARTCTARAAEDAEVIEISPALFDRMIRSNIELAVRMLRKLSLRLADAEARLARQPASTAAEQAPAATVQISPPPPAPPPDAAPPAAPEPAVRPQPPQRARPSAATGNGAPCLVNPEGSEVFPLEAELVRVGRFDPVTGTRPEVDLTLLDLKRSVSRRHAVLTAQDGSYFLAEEVGALNGTLVNGSQLASGQPVEVQDGDVLSFGSVNLTFRAAAG